MPFLKVKLMILSQVGPLLAFLIAQKLYRCKELAERILKKSFRITKTSKCWIIQMLVKKERTKFKARL